MANEKTEYLDLPLPHPDNLLEGDVYRLIEAFGLLDGNAAAVAQKLLNLDTTVAAAQAAAEKAQTAAGSAQSSADAAALKTIAIATTAPLTGGGNLSANRTLKVNAASTTAVGVVQLNNTCTSTSIVQAATASAAKQAYDRGTAGVNAAATVQKAVDKLTASPSGVPLFDNATGKFYCPGYVGQFKGFQLPSPPEGWAVRNGQVLTNADKNYPDLWAALQHKAFASLCKTLAQWNALSSAAGGVGGVPFFVVDTAAKTIKLPDTRGDYMRDAGSSYLQAVGEWHQDDMKNHWHEGISTWYDGGWETVASPDWFANKTKGALYTNGVVAPNSRTPMYAADNRTRAYGTLGCVCVGPTQTQPRVA